MWPCNPASFYAFSFWLADELQYDLVAQSVEKYWRGKDTILTTAIKGPNAGKMWWLGQTDIVQI